MICQITITTRIIITLEESLLVTFQELVFVINKKNHLGYVIQICNHWNSYLYDNLDYVVVNIMLLKKYCSFPFVSSYLLKSKFSESSMWVYLKQIRANNLPAFADETSVSQCMKTHCFWALSKKCLQKCLQIEDNLCTTSARNTFLLR